MKHLLPLIILLFCGLYSCSDNNTSTATDKISTAQLDSLKIDSLRKDSLAAVYKKTEMVVYGDAKFGMTEKEYTKALPRQDNFIGTYEYYFHPQYSKEGKLYSLEIQSTQQDASHIDTDISDKVENLYDVISKKYGPPTFNYGTPDFFKYKPGYVQYKYGWELGNKTIAIGIAEESAGAKYYATCDITHKPMMLEVIKSYQDQADSEKSKDSENF